MKFSLEPHVEVKAVLDDIMRQQSFDIDFDNLDTFRANWNQLVLAGIQQPTPYDEQVRATDRLIPADHPGGHIRLRIYSPATITEPVPALYWIHGGGLIIGIPEQDEGFLKSVVATLGCVVVAVDYRLAPEHPYPAALEDCYDGLLWVAAHAKELGIDAARLAIGGNSAGAGLAAATTLLARDKNGPALIHQSLAYPMLDYRSITHSSYEITDLGIWDRDINQRAWNAYLGSLSAAGAGLPYYAAPAVASDLSGLPPAFMAVGSLDLFRDEDIQYAQQLMAAGVSTELYFQAGVPHCFDLAAETNVVKKYLQARIQALGAAFMYN
ncbi:alpha/beta hydrolase [Chitinophaga nivalis]|uniref:Alpha/beta hydrolase n=1 Tax=Chitinophaga nivalis TaxID=2991709 RepID=A0ABT3IP97_9BACT|nr:alpha/beta hydrolase [Chitinophaga nivalis]MCW3464508.1 alpha/beta hydrolase [Chitinophaga nivalis]MCW3485801.1 alpha/beta hydrolase [Chitinophaga nivalis]